MSASTTKAERGGDEAPSELTERPRGPTSMAVSAAAAAQRHRSAALPRSRRRAARSLLAAAFLACATAADAPPPPLELTSHSFDDAWKAHDLLLVEFYWNGSEAHAALNATLPAALALAAERGAAATLARVDAEREPRLRKRFRVPAQGPRHDRSALRLFRRELPEPVPYTRAWTEAAVADFLVASVGAPAQTLQSVGEAVALTEGERSVVIGFFDTHEVAECAAQFIRRPHAVTSARTSRRAIRRNYSNGRPLLRRYEVFVKAARSLLGSATAAGVSFAEVLEPSLIREFEIVYTPMLFVFRPGEDAIACAGRASDPREGTAAQFGAIRL